MTPSRPADGPDSDPTDPTDATHYVVGGAHVGRAIAARMQTAGHRVAVVDDDYHEADPPGLAADPTDMDALSEAGVDTAIAVVVATPSDRRNLLIARLVRARFDVPRVIPLVHTPDRVPLFADPGQDPFCVTTALADAVGDTV